MVEGDCWPSTSASKLMFELLLLAVQAIVTMLYCSLMTTLSVGLTMLFKFFFNVTISTF